MTAMNKGHSLINMPPSSSKRSANHSVTMIHRTHHHHHSAHHPRRRHRLLTCATTTTTTTSPRTVTSATSSATAGTSAVSISDTQIASITAGILSRILLHPIDCIKTRLQHFRSHSSSSAESTKALLRFIVNERIPGLYRGISGAIFGVVPYSLLYMPSYELAQHQLSTWLGQKELFGFRHILAGSFAGLCGSLIKVPVDVIKKRTQAGLHPNVLAAILSIVNEPSSSATRLLQVPLLLRNVGGFYAGWRSAIIYSMPYNSIQFLVLENVKRAASSLRSDGKLTGTDNVFVGALTGMITSIITEPLDVVKTRMMTQTTRGAAVNAQQASYTVYRGWLHCMSTIMKEEGTAALWKGTLPRLIWVGASSAVWYGTYQAVKQAMSTRRTNKRQIPRRSEVVDAELDKTKTKIK